MQEQQIFQHYELKNWEFSPRIYKILAASAILNIFLVIGLAQANFLTAKSCDTPLMSQVCSVLDAVYVGSMILDTDTGYVNEEYVKTELEDADITFIDLTGSDKFPPLEYPAGYFAVANPETLIDDSIISTADLAQNTNPTLGNTYIPGITGNTKNPTINNGTITDLSTKPQATPKPNKNPVIGVLPGENPTVKKNQPTKKPTNENSTQEQANVQENTDNTNQNQETKSEPVKDVTINREVLKTFGSFVKGEVVNNKVDLNQPFKIVAEGPLTKDGKFDITQDKKTKKSKTQITFSEGNPQMVSIAKNALEAIGDSGVLGYLRNFGAENVKITLIQDGEKIAARIESDLKDANKANTMASGLNTLLSLAKGRENLNEDEKLLLSGAQKPTSNGSMFIVDFAIPKEAAQGMINRNLEKLPLPSPTPGNQTTAK
jgi:hypothetical protein